MPDGGSHAWQVPLDLLGHNTDRLTDDQVDEGAVLSLGRRYRSSLDRLRSLDERWLAMEDDARCWLGNVDASKFDVAAAAHGALMDSENLFLAVFRRRTETVADISIKAIHAAGPWARRGCPGSGAAGARGCRDYRCEDSGHGLRGGGWSAGSDVAAEKRTE
jgi:hypothetical protein